ncbi:MAG TPA: hypothetical protein VGL10_05480 [Gammaproteobacteria bacterium]
MNPQRKLIPGKGLFFLLLLYTAASLLHFVHNAVFLNEYPNMPVWLSAAEVMGAWCMVAAVGVVGYLLLRWGWKIAGLLILAVYGALGFAGLDHYWLAPISAHSFMMNLTVWFEVLTGLGLILAAVTSIIKNFPHAYRGN